MNVDGEDEKNVEEMKIFFFSVESAMEVWVMFVIVLGYLSFIKFEFEKLCFFDNDIIDI